MEVQVHASPQNLTRDELIALTGAFQIELTRTRLERDHFKEQLNAKLRALYAAKSEARGADQRELVFNEAEARVGRAPVETTVPVRAHRKQKPGRRPLDPALPREILRHELPEAERVCAQDGTRLVAIGVEVSEQLDIEPAAIKVIRHDVVMDAKQRMGWKDLPTDERPSLAQLAYEAGSCWLREREARFGCQFESQRLRVDSHFVHCLKGRRDEKGNCRGIVLSTLDFEGELSVTDPGIFLSALLKGIGPAKGFGCGLLLVRRL